MVSAMDDLDALVLVLAPLHTVDQPVLAGDPTGPRAREIALQCLRLAQSPERMPGRILDQLG